MIGSRKSSLRFTAIAVVLLCCALVFAVPPRSRTVRKSSWPDAPVEIIAVVVKGKPVILGKPFAGNDKWLGSLTVRVKNTSAKRVSWVRVALKFINDKSPEVRLTDFMTYGIGRTDIEKLRGGGPPLGPGDTAEVSYSWEQYQSVREILDGMSYPKSIAQIEVSVDKVSFEGEPDVMWIEGQMNKQNTDRPGWSPIKP
jgi:hypothetical protein